MGVPIGQLKHRVRLQSRTQAAVGTSDASDEFNTFATVWAKVVTTKGVELRGAIAAGDLSATHRFVIRYRSGVSADTSIAWQGRRYQVLDVENPDGRRELLDLLCRDIGPAA